MKTSWTLKGRIKFIPKDLDVKEANLHMYNTLHGCLRTSRDHSLNSSAIDESSLDGLGADIRPVYTVLQRVIVHHSHVVDVRHSKGDDVVVVGVVNVHSPDLDLAGIQQELARLCGGEKTG